MAAKEHGFTTIEEIQKMPIEPVSFLVEGLILSRTLRASLICGKPESGKSSLARMLAACVASGRDFLGRTVVAGEVLYYGTEESPRDLARLLNLAGYDSGRDKTIHALEHQENQPLAQLHDYLVAHPAISLCILEPLDALLRIPDIKDNSNVREAFDRLHTLVINNLYQSVSFVGIVQMKKRDSDEAGTMILGATELRARTSNKIYLRRVSDNDPRRIIATQLREGREILPTYLDYDAETRTSTLGVPVADERKQLRRTNEEELDEKLIAFLTEHSDATEEEILAAIPGSSWDSKRHLLQKKRSAGLIVRSGRGVKGDPLRFSLNTIETEGVAA